MIVLLLACSAPAELVSASSAVSLHLLSSLLCHSALFWLNGKESLTVGVVYKQKKDGKTQQE
jgi:hypothetical protein